MALADEAMASRARLVKNGTVTLVPVHRSGQKLQVMPPQPVLDAMADLKDA